MIDVGPTESIAVANRSHNIFRLPSDPKKICRPPLFKGESEGISSSIKLTARAAHTSRKRLTLRGRLRRVLLSPSEKAMSAEDCACDYIHLPNSFSLSPQSSLLSPDKFVTSTFDIQYSMLE
jgi:hypothetical protein